MESLADPKMLERNLIGRESEPVRVKIEYHKVRKFAEAIGIPFENKVPPTFVGIFIQGEIDGIKLLIPGVIHGEQKFTYYKPVSIGDIIIHTSRIKDVTTRVGNLGKLSFVVIETIGRNPAAEDVFNINSTVIFLERRNLGETPLGLSN